jgi:hypothetical protein
VVVLQTQCLSELRNGNELDIEDAQYVVLRGLEASVWTLAVPVMALPLAVLQIAITTSRRAGLWGERLDKLRLVWTVPDLPAVHSSVVSKTLDKFKNSLKRPKQVVDNVAPREAPHLPPPNPSPTPSPPSPKLRIVADWTEIESNSLLNNQPRSEDLVDAIGKFGNASLLNPYTQRTLTGLQRAINQR